MDKIKSIINNLLFPNIFVYIISILLGFSSIVITFIYKLDNSVFAYISYVLSAYALILIVIKIPKLYRNIYKILNNIKWTNKLIHNRDYRDIVSMYLGVILNISYISYKFIIGIILKSLWMGVTAVYYLLLTSIRYFLLRNVKKDISYIKKVRIYRLVGILLFLLTITMAGMTVSTILGKKMISYPGHIIYVVALYTFYNFIIAIINLIKYRKMDNPIFSAVKMISLSTACMSMFVLQSALISAFGNDMNYALLMNSLTGTFVLLIVIGIAIYMITKANKIIKESKGE